MSNTVHDMGGMHGFGPVVAEPREPPFHENWEGRVLAMQRAMGATGLWTIDGGRASLETLPPLAYLAASYYERWFLGLERRVIAHGLVGEDEIAAGRSLRPGMGLNRKLTLEDAKGTRYPRFDRPAPAPARFKPGDRVTTRTINPATHTRLPRYARGKRGTVVRCYGAHDFPDTNAHGLGPQPQPVYSVCFEGSELWGASAEPNQKLYLDLWESYLEPAK